MIEPEYERIGRQADKQRAEDEVRLIRRDYFTPEPEVKDGQ